MNRMKNITRWLVCLVGITMACGGGGGDCVTCPPPQTDVCPNIAGVQTEVPTGMVKDNAGNCVTPPPQRTLDSMDVVLAPADSFDTAPVGMSVKASWTGGDTTIQIPSWYNAHRLIVPINIGSMTLRVNGGSKYETRTWSNLQSGNGLRYGAVPHPNCWSIRVGDFAGQTRCLSSNLFKGEIAFYSRNTPAPVISPWGWAENLLPAKVYLADPFSAGAPWSASDSTLVASQISRVNQAWGRNVLIMAGRTSDTLFATGTIKVHRWTIDGQPSVAVHNGVAGEISAGRVKLDNTWQIGAGNVAGLAHEFMHTLGFSHTCGWVTWMRTGVCQDKYSPTNWFTADDIAGFQMAYAIRSQSKRISANLPWF